jgi:hypothetical protein
MTDFSEPELKWSAMGEEVNAAAYRNGTQKDIFPAHSAGPAACGSVLEQLLGSIATPSRAHQSGPPAVSQVSSYSGIQRNGIPCGPPAHAPTLLAPPTLPPPPLMPAPVYQAPQQQWEPPRTAAPQLSPEASFGSYRERLQAGGRCAFQRNIEAGLMPKAMRQEAPCYVPLQQPEMQNGAVMQYDSQYEYALAGDGQHMWSGAGQMQSNDCWQVPVDQTDYTSQCAYMQQVPQMQQQMASPEISQLLGMTDQLSMPPQAQQQMQVQMPFQVQQSQFQQMAPMAMDEQSMQMLQMQSPQMQLPQLPQMELPQTPMSQMSGESTPCDIDRCMAIVMPQDSQSQCDRDFMALQLKAAAELQQCYED